METTLTVIALVAYAAGMFWLTSTFVKKRQSATYFNVADRKTGTIQAGLSIAATWIWAPALFVASTQAYNNGWVGLFWFLVPNVITLLFIIPFAKKLRERYPNGFTLSGFMGKTYNRTVRSLYQFELGALSTLSIAVQLLAGAFVVTIISGIPFWVATIILLGIVYLYAIRHGIKSSLFTDAIQMVVILGALAVFVPYALALKGWDSIIAGANGVNIIGGLATPEGVNVALTFGIISAIGLMAGPIGDQAFWQRVFATDKTKIAKSFGFAAFAFALVPLLMSVFGFIAAGTDAEVNNPGYVNLEIIQALFPAWVVVPFMFLLLSGLLSTIDSQMLALSSLSTDFTRDIRYHRATMIIGSLIALGIANIPGNSVLFMFLVYGTLRAATFAITVLTLAGVKLKSAAVTTGLLTSMVGGFPVFLYGNLNGIDELRLWGSIATVTASGLIAYVGTKLVKEKV